jgi:hypothetical protein
MRNYLKLFKNYNEYETVSEKPTVGHCISDIVLHYIQTSSQG